jgi:hypothetical protein
MIKLWWVPTFTQWEDKEEPAEETEERATS